MYTCQSPQQREKILDGPRRIFHRATTARYPKSQFSCGFEVQNLHRLAREFFALPSAAKDGMRVLKGLRPVEGRCLKGSSRAGSPPRNNKQLGGLWSRTSWSALTRQDSPTHVHPELGFLAGTRFAKSCLYIYIIHTHTHTYTHAHICRHLCMFL